MVLQDEKNEWKFHDCGDFMLSNVHELAKSHGRGDNSNYVKKKKKKKKKSNFIFIPK